MKRFDAIIIRTGQGPSRARRFSAAGKTVAIIEHGKLAAPLCEPFVHSVESTDSPSESIESICVKTSRRRSRTLNA